MKEEYATCQNRVKREQQPWRKKPSLTRPIARPSTISRTTRLFDLRLINRTRLALLLIFDVEQAVWITAYNPGSQLHSEDDNLTNQMQLLERIETMRLNYFVGHSCDAAGDWFEPGYLVLGMDETVGIELGREFAARGGVHSAKWRA